MKNKILAFIIGLMVITSIGASAASLPEENFTGWFCDKETKVTQYYENGNKAINKWIKSGETNYYLKDDGGMATGWLQLNNNWYHFSNNGAMQKGWFKDSDGKYYYLNTDGVMLHDTTTPDGYKLNSSGVWVQ